MIKKNSNRSSGYYRAIAAVLFFLGSSACRADTQDSPPARGNFSLLSSQQPGPLMSFGEDIINKNVTQLYLFTDDFAGVNQHFVDVMPSVLYGITDSLSIFINAPYAASYRTGKARSSGFEDAFVQMEYGFYSKSTASFVEQYTAVFSVSLPTGSVNDNPATGLGAPGFFLGTTYNRTYVDWFMFGSGGILLPASHKGTQMGNNYLYQFGLGRNLAATPQGMLAFMTEINGTYTEHDRIYAHLAPNSGGNIVYITPSLWGSTRHAIIQLGVGWPVLQHANGNQLRQTYLLVANVAWTFGSP